MRNDANVQAVQWNDGSVMVAFYKADNFDAKGAHWKVDRPCLLMWSAGELRASDPTQKGGEVNVWGAGKTVKIALPADGTTSEPARVAPR